MPNRTAEEQAAYFSLHDRVLAQFRGNVRDYDGDATAYYPWRGNVDQAFRSARFTFEQSCCPSDDLQEWAFVSIAAASLTGKALKLYQAEVIPSSHSSGPHFKHFHWFLQTTDGLFGVTPDVARERKKRLRFDPQSDWRDFRADWLELSNIAQSSISDEYCELKRAISDDRRRSRLEGLEGATVRTLLDAADREDGETPFGAVKRKP